MQLKQSRRNENVVVLFAIVESSSTETEKILDYPEVMDISTDVFERHSEDGRKIAVSSYDQVNTEQSAMH